MAGMFLGLLLQFVAKIAIARYGLEANYGIFSLALVILSFAMIVSSLGLHVGGTRYIAYFASKGDKAKVRATITASIQMATAASIVIFLLLFFGADFIALSLFHTPDLVPALKIFAVGTPFFTLINILVAVFRGFDRVEPQIYFQFIMLNALFPLLLIVPIMLDLPFVSVFCTYLAALVITFIALIAYTGKKLSPLTRTIDKGADISIRKDLLLFSAPLFGNTVFSMIISWADTLMIGYFKTAEAVGLYNAAYPLAQFIVQPLAALTLIYVPVATALFSQNMITELKRNYAILTKWLVFLTLPIFLILFLFPEAVLNYFFGQQYIYASLALRILSLGFMVNNFFGPNGPMLIAMGESMWLFWAGLAAAGANIMLNIILIPLLGIVGAAISSMVAMVLGNIIPVAKLFVSYRAQPLSKNLLKPLVSSLVLAFLLWIWIYFYIVVSWWMVPLLFILYYVVYIVTTIFTRSFDDEDMALLRQIAERSGVDATPFEKFTRRFR